MGRGWRGMGIYLFVAPTKSSDFCDFGRDRLRLSPNFPSCRIHIRRRSKLRRFSLQIHQKSVGLIRLDVLRTIAVCEANGGNTQRRRAIYAQHLCCYILPVLLAAQSSVALLVRCTLIWQSQIRRGATCSSPACKRACRQVLDWLSVVIYCAANPHQIFEGFLDEEL